MNNIIQNQMDMMLRCMKIKKRYITLVKRARYSQEAVNSAASALSPSSSAVSFTAIDEIELRRIEESLPIQALLVYRQFAAFEIITETKREEREMQKEGKGKNLLMASFGWTSNAHNNPIANGNNTIAIKEKGFTKLTLSPSSVSSWFRLNMKKSVNKAKGHSDQAVGIYAENQKYSKKVEKTIEIDDESREDEEEDEKIIEIIQSRLELDPIAVDQFAFRLVLNSSAALRLTSEERPVAVLEVAMSSTTEMKADGIVVQFALDDFQLIDECTVGPFSKYLIVCASASTSTSTSVPQLSKQQQQKQQQTQSVIAPTPVKGPINPFSQPASVPVPVSLHALSSPSPSKQKKVGVIASPSTAATSKDSNVPKLLCVMDSRHGKSVLRLTVQPMEATWNELCVGRLLGIFLSPDVTHNTVTASTNIPSSTPSSASSFSPLLAASMSKFAMDAALPIAGEMEIIIEIDAPKIILPDDTFKDSGCLLFDTGYLVIRGTPHTIHIFP